MIPNNQFCVFTVVSCRTHITLGAYFTFGDAYDRISELVDGGRLVEEYPECAFSSYVYYLENAPSRKYVISTSLLTYHDGDHIVEYDDMILNKKRVTSMLQ